MKEKLEAIRVKAEAELNAITDPAELENFRIAVLGKKGELTAILKQMGKLTPEERPVMGQLANEVRSYIENLIAEALKIDQGRMNRYCRTVNPKFIEQVNKKKPSTMAQLADLWYTSNGADYGRSQHYNDSRYHMLNLHATFTKGTVEFRLFQFDKPANGKKNGLHAG